MGEVISLNEVRQKKVKKSDKQSFSSLYWDWLSYFQAVPKLIHTINMSNDELIIRHALFNESYCDIDFFDGKGIVDIEKDLYDQLLELEAKIKECISEMKNHSYYPYSDYYIDTIESAIYDEEDKFWMT